MITEQPLLKFPVMCSIDYFNIQKVYRMENSKGEGPIVGSSARELKLLRHFKAHLLPQCGISLNREVYPDNELFSRENYHPMLKAGVFGWRSRELYDAFFIGDGELHCNDAGFFLVEYEPVKCLPFPDGQVLFIKS